MLSKLRERIMKSLHPDDLILHKSGFNNDFAIFAYVQEVYETD